MKGVCTVCQSVKEVSRSSLAVQQLIDDLGYEEEDLAREYGEEIHYLVDEHEFCGQRCDGVGQIPQVLVKGG